MSTAPTPDEVRGMIEALGFVWPLHTIGRGYEVVRYAVCKHCGALVPLDDNTYGTLPDPMMRHHVWHERHGHGD